jgi:two-component system, cell cycle sensor histidine kinase and response regulator CckA
MKMPRLLIVDDEPMVLDVLRRLLVEPEREVEVASGPEEALEIAGRLTIDVALVDKNLLGASGLELSRKLKTIQPELEVILITGYASLETAVEAIQIGAFDYLTKPIDDYASLSLKVQSAIEKSRLRRNERALIERLKEAEVRYRSLVEAAPDAVVVHDPQGRIRDVNTAAAKLYGIPADELCKMRVDDLGPRAQGRQKHRKKSGEEFFADVSSTVLVLDGEELRILSVRDATDLVRTERERALLEDRLRVAQKMEAVGRLAGGVAHDFNNLLAVISAHAEFLDGQLGKGHPSSPEVEGISKAAQRGAALTRQLLLFSRHKPVAHDIIDVNQAVTDVQRLLTRVLGENVQLVASSNPELWSVRADTDQIGQVLINLAVNARDAMPKGGRIRMSSENVRIEASRVLRGGDLVPGRYVCLTIEDSGIGMTDEVLARLFEPFFTTKETGKGTGLGLATVYGIVKSAGGAIDVDSKPGSGTTFRVFLPAVDEQHTQAGRAQASPERGRGETILVVEDEDPLRALVRRILVTHGYSVLEARDGEDGLRRSGEHQGPIHLLLTDIVMPQMTGRELAQRLGTVRPDIRVLFMTGYTEHAVVESANGSALLNKPFSTMALLGNVRKLLDLPRS